MWKRCGVPFGPLVHVPADATAARWIAAALGGFGSVGGLVPQGYQRYLLLDFRGGEPLGSEGVCRLFGQLVPVLAPRTTTPDQCWFAIWEGHGFGSFTTSVVALQPPKDDGERRELERERRRLRDDDLRRNTEVRSALSELPSFDLPNRRYYLLGGAVTAASGIERPDGPFPQPPDLWWPQDRRWFVGGDTDLDWCYVAGSEGLVATVDAALSGRTRPVDWRDANAAAGEQR